MVTGSMKILAGRTFFLATSLNRPEIARIGFNKWPLQDKDWKTRGYGNEIPHSYGRLIHMISVELRNSKHSFCEHCQESYELYKRWKAEEQVCDITTNRYKNQHTQHIIRKLCPIPEVSSVKIWIKTTTNNTVLSSHVNVNVLVIGHSPSRLFRTNVNK